MKKKRKSKRKRRRRRKRASSLACWKSTRWALFSVLSHQRDSRESPTFRLCSFDPTTEAFLLQVFPNELYDAATEGFINKCHPTNGTDSQILPDRASLLLRYYSLIRCRKPASSSSNVLDIVTACVLPTSWNLLGDGTLRTPKAKAYPWICHRYP